MADEKGLVSQQQLTDLYKKLQLLEQNYWLFEELSVLAMLANTFVFLLLSGYLEFLDVIT